MVATLQIWAKHMAPAILIISDRHGWVYADAAITSAAQRKHATFEATPRQLEKALRAEVDALHAGHTTPKVTDEEWIAERVTLLKPALEIGQEHANILISSYARLRCFRSGKPPETFYLMLKQTLASFSQNEYP